MRKTIGLITSILLIVACKSEPIEPFELSVADYNYSMAYSVLYKLSNKNLTIIFRGELENEKDSILFSTIDLPKRKLKQLSKINIDSLSVFYSNNCMKDGDIKSFYFKKNGIYKRIQLQNYYHNELSPTIEIINELVPKKYRMYYNKENLIKGMERCDSFKIIKDWKDINS